ncbi:hypothetical protein [Candidatus Blastococcus massiliensis]|uniref:hypothetical protein n=1 Tax=Candidatus Blastococcus massiliensis TaxID=1470358 RepID=UPI0004B2186A|nr:hypothetical protein [Candidatus Blastococcus massiliensis]
MGRLLSLTAALCLSLAACGTDDAVERIPAPALSPSTETAGGDPVEAPSWYGQRRELPSCGVDEPSTEGYPNLEARTCFREAFDAGRPAELTHSSYGDEGESIRAHFRVLGDGRYEIVGERFPGAPPSGGHGWVRYECERFVFFGSPGAESDGAPWIDYGGECELVESVEK